MNSRKTMRKSTLIILLTVVSTAGCQRPLTADDHQYARDQMVARQIEGRGLKDPNVLAAMRTVPRHLFMPKNVRGWAYRDSAAPIGEGQTISQPYIVALMTSAAKLAPTDRVLEIGTGSGYQAAILAEIVGEVYTIEIVETLALRSRKLLTAMGYKNIFFKHGDGYQGWAEHAPFDAILVTAAPPQIPPKLVDQLKVGGRMVVPVGDYYQELMLITKTDQGLKKSKLLPVRFVPMVKEKK